MKKAGIVNGEWARKGRGIGVYDREIIFLSAVISKWKMSEETEEWLELKVRAKWHVMISILRMFLSAYQCRKVGF